MILFGRKDLRKKMAILQSRCLELEEKNDNLEKKVLTLEEEISKIKEDYEGAVKSLVEDTKKATENFNKSLIEQKQRYDEWLNGDSSE